MTEQIERRRAQQREYYARNREARLEAVRKYRAENPEKAAEAVRSAWEKNGAQYRKREAEWRARPEVKERLAAQKRIYFASERHVELRRARQQRPDVKLANRIRAGVRRSLRTGRDWSSLSVMGYTLDDLRLHLERQFRGGMSWENMHAWHIDHIVPLSSMSIQTREDIARAWALPNLRPLWAKDNLSKGAKLEKLL